MSRREVEPATSWFAMKDEDWKMVGCALMMLSGGITVALIVAAAAFLYWVVYA